ncbi:ABC transporter permease [Streptococcus panodentis]|uniref:ABC transporter permease n=1 Tax=Streptococcus panodentis TaxID=1581472 RepID=A0ABS5AZ88_9STRE|nr:ABC transporter permease subunit [Streptococcus panodentis]MBP2621893.1 hypothetical protein [Streptococcus panodentis]
MKALVPFELKKLFKKKSVLGAILVSILVLAGMFYPTFFSDGQLSGVSTDRIHGREAAQIQGKIAEEHTGYLSDDLMEKIVNDYAARMPYLKDNNIYDIFSWDTIDRLVSNGREILPETYQSDEVLHYENVKLKSQKELGSALPLKSLKLGNYASWNQLYTMLGSAFSLVIVLFIYICSPVFSGDAAKKMNSLILTTKYGRNRLTASKFLTVFGVSILIFLIVYAIVLSVFTWYFGWSGGDTSVQMNLYWINITYNILQFPIQMNLLELLIHLIVYQFVGLLFMVALTVLISSLTKSTLVTFATSVGIFLAPDFLMNIFRNGVINKLLTIFSVSTNEIEGILLKLSSSKGFFFDDFTSNGVAIMVIRLLLVFVCCFATYRIVRKRGI